MHNYNLDDMVEILRKSAGGRLTSGMLSWKSLCVVLFCKRKARVKNY